MARKIRVEYEGAIYHFMNRGDRREPIFKGDPDRKLFLETLDHTCAKYRAMRRGGCIGGEEFRQELLGRMTERLGAEHYGEERAETQTERAERIIVEELKKRKWMEKDLRKRPKGDGEKVAIARRLRAETVITVSWISQRLHLGSRNYANLLLSRAGE